MRCAGALLLLPPPAAAAAAAGDAAALRALYAAAGGAGWTNNSGWLQGDPCDSGAAWDGVTCAGGRVTGLSLNFGNSGNNLQGTVPPELAGLTFLDTLLVNNNKGLSGTLPAGLWQGWPRLRTVFMNNCQLSGPIPPVAGLSGLQTLQLDGQHKDWHVGDGGGFTGPVPDLSGLPNLTTLDLGYNRLSGELPDAFPGGLRMLFLTNNSLSGTIPTGVGDLTGLSFLQLDENILSGTVPAALARMPALMFLQLDRNRLSGPLPALPYSTYQHCELGGNGFDCPLPDGAAAACGATCG